MSAEQTQDLYKQLVYWVVEIAPQDWQSVEINMEILVDNQEIANSWVIKCYQGNELEKVTCNPDGAQKLKMRDLFLTLNELAAQSGDRWTVCDFTVFNDGRYRVDYSYGAPPRLSGDLRAGTTKTA